MRFQTGIVEGYPSPRVPHFPPIAETRPKTIRVHGDELVDEFGWLRDLENPGVLAYLEAENQYTGEVMRDTEKIREALIAEMQARFQPADTSVAYRLDDYLYYYRTTRDQQYPIYCRKHGSVEAPEEVILDLNELSVGHDYFGLGAFRVSPDHSLLAYSVDTTGSEAFSLKVKDLSSGTLLPDTREEIFGNLEWSNDGRSLLYVAIDSSIRPYELRRFRLGSPEEEDALVHSEQDPAFYVSIRKTKTRKYILIEIESLSSSEVRFFDAGTADEPRVIDRRRAGVEYSVEHQEGRLIIASDMGEIRRRLFQAPEDEPGPSSWVEFAVDEELDVEEVEAFRNHLVIGGRKNGLPQVLVVDGSGSQHYLEFDEPAYTVDILGNPEYDSAAVRLRYSSLVTPHSILDYDMSERKFEVLKRLEVASGYDRKSYETVRVTSQSEDGTPIPISVAYRRDLLRRDGSNPALLNGYGAYGETSDPEFSLERLSLLDRGFVFAIAHTRGGGEFGEKWHEAGRLLNKKRTFLDFISCAELLIREGYTSADRLVADGRSAGGLLVGAVINLRPDLFGAAVADVPFVDVVNTMLDSSLPLTAVEFDEWGDPQQPDSYSYMKSYSPYEGVRPQEYPHLLVTTSMADARVPFWEPAKWVARIRVAKKDDNLLLLRVLGAGHAGTSGRLDYLREEAFKQAFLLKVLEMDF